MYRIVQPAYLISARLRGERSVLICQKSPPARSSAVFEGVVGGDLMLWLALWADDTSVPAKFDAIQLVGGPYSHVTTVYQRLDM